MQFTTILSLLAFGGAASQLAAAAPSNQARDIWDPKMTYPTASTVWQAGNTYTVTWETADKPAQLTDTVGHINLRIGGNEIPFVLADNFNLTAGHVDVVAPLVYTASDYSLVLYGDSGNIGPDFKIVGYSV